MLFKDRVQQRISINLRDGVEIVKAPVDSDVLRVIFRKQLKRILLRILY